MVSNSRGSAGFAALGIGSDTEVFLLGRFSIWGVWRMKPALGFGQKPALVIWCLGGPLWRSVSIGIGLDMTPFVCGFCGLPHGR